MQTFKIRNNRTPEAMDSLFSQMPGGVRAQLSKDTDGTYIDENGCFVVEVTAGSVDFLKFACRNQGYADVVDE